MATGELAIRIIDPFVLRPPGPPYNTADKNDKLGWVPKANYSYEGSMIDAGGVWYDVNLHTTHGGFKEYGDPSETEKPKVFFLGDSYTQSVEVSNEHTFYRQLADELDFELFAFGMSAYGTLQEYMILDQYIDEVDPDLVVLQVCSNDLLDNHYKLERESKYHTKIERPYMDTTGNIYYDTPIPKALKFIGPSKFLMFLNDKMVSLFPEHFKSKRFAEGKIPKEKRKYENYAYSLEVTDMLIKKIKDRLGPNTKLAVITADSFLPQTRNIRFICEKYKIPFFIQPAKAIYKAKKKEGKIVNSKDNYHWNELGHQIVAHSLKKPLQSLLPQLQDSTVIAIP